MTLLLQTGGGCDFDPEHLLDVFGHQRQRFVTELRRFGPADWAGRSRCAEWSAHEVVRHLCDTNMNAIVLEPEDRTLDVSTGYDPRITPRQWLTASDGETPDATFRRFLETTEERFARDRARLAQGRRFDVRLPYGPADWTVRMLHGFWDSWLHERDVLLANGGEHPTDGDATAYATAYGLFIAAAVASRFGAQVHEKLTFGGAGGGVFDVDNRDGVTLTVTREATAGPPAAAAADALAGRAAGEALGDLPDSSRTALLAATLAALPAGDALTFTRLQDMIGLTPGNLLIHLRKLEEAGYISSEKTKNGAAPKTTVALTGHGRAALNAYTRALRELLGGLSGPGL